MMAHPTRNWTSQPAGAAGCYGVDDAGLAVPRGAMAFVHGAIGGSSPGYLHCDFIGGDSRRRCCGAYVPRAADRGLPCQQRSRAARTRPRSSHVSRWWPDAARSGPHRDCLVHRLGVGLIPSWRRREGHRNERTLQDIRRTRKATREAGLQEDEEGDTRKRGRGGRIGFRCRRMLCAYTYLAEKYWKKCVYRRNCGHGRCGKVVANKVCGNVYASGSRRPVGVRQFAVNGRNVYWPNGTTCHRGNGRTRGRGEGGLSWRGGQGSGEGWRDSGVKKVLRCTHTHQGTPLMMSHSRHRVVDCTCADHLTWHRHARGYRRPVLECVPRCPGPSAWGQENQAGPGLGWCCPSSFFVMDGLGRPRHAPRAASGAAPSAEARGLVRGSRRGAGQAVETQRSGHATASPQLDCAAPLGRHMATSGRARGETKDGRGEGKW